MTCTVPHAFGFQTASLPLVVEHRNLGGEAKGFSAARNVLFTFYNGISQLRLPGRLDFKRRRCFRIERGAEIIEESLTVQEARL